MKIGTRGATPRRNLLRAGLLWVLLTVPFGPANAADYFAGRTISLIVGLGPGGGYDLYARILARHLGQYIPGKPNVVVQNMTGAGGVRAANYVYATAAKDGTVIAAVNQGATLFQQLGGKGAEYDPAKFNWIGRLGSSNNTIYTWTATGIRSIEDAKKREVSMAGSGIIADADIYPNVTNALVGTRFKIIDGYAGTNESNLAIERGEVDGRGGGAYSSLVNSHPQWLRDGSVSVLVQVGLTKEPELPNVPRLTDLVSGEADRQVAELVTTPVEIGYNYWVAPEVPGERLELLRHAFDQAARDPAMLAEAKSQSLEIRYKSGRELQDMVSATAKTPKAIIERTAKIVGW